MNLPKVTVGVIVFKETKYLNWSLTSLLDQDYPDVEYVIRDHSPNGEVYEWLKENHPDFFKQATITVEDNATMHSGGHNAMIRNMLKHKRDIYFCVSNDMLYPRNFVSEMVKAMQKSKAHVGTCKLMRWDFQKAMQGELEASKTDYIDSFGIGLTKGHHFFDTGQGTREGEFKGSKSIIGPSGAVGAYDKVALEAIAYKNNEGEMEYFDETLYYKNDCDLAYRLSWAGLKCVVADVKVYHDRQLGDKGTGALTRLKGHHQKADWAKESSLFGQLVTLQKNFDRNYSFPVKFKTKMNQIARYFYTVFFAPKMLESYRKAALLKAEIRDRKKQMMKKISAREMEKLMT